MVSESDLNLLNKLSPNKTFLESICIRFCSTLRISHDIASASYIGFKYDYWTPVKK